MTRPGGLPWSMFGRILITVLVVFLILYSITLEKLIDRLEELNVWAGAVAVLLVSAQNIMASVRWWGIVEQLTKKDIGAFNAVSILYVATFLNQGLPSSVGGDTYRVFRCLRQGFEFASSVGSIVLDRLVALIILTLMSCVALVVFYQDKNLRGLLFAAFATLILLVIVSIGVVLMAKRVSPSWLSRRISDIAFAIQKLISSLLILRAFIKIWLSSLFGFILMSLCVLILARSITIEVTVLECLLLCPPVFIAAALPITVGGWGLREGAMVILFGSVGVNDQDALFLSVLFGVVVLVASLPGLLVLLIRRRRGAELN